MSGPVSRGGEVQRRIRGQDRPLQLTQLRPRLQAEFRHEHLAGVAVGRQRLGLTAGPVQRQHLLPAQPLPQRVLANQPGQALADLLVPPQGQLQVQAELRRGQPLLGQLGRRGLDQRAGHPGERLATPQPQRGMQPLDRRRRIPLRLAPGVRHEPGEDGQVHRVVGNLEYVPGTDRADRIRPLGLGQRAAQRRHADLHLDPGGGRWIDGPERVDEPVHRHHPAAAEQQHRQDRPLPGGADPQLAVRADQAQRTEDPILHRMAPLWNGATLRQVPRPAMVRRPGPESLQTK